MMLKVYDNICLDLTETPHEGLDPWGPYHTHAHCPMDCDQLLAPHAPPPENPDRGANPLG